MALTIILNGQQRVFKSLENGADLNLLLEVLDLKPDRIALELNGLIAPRGTWSNISLRDGDNIELVHFVGGGCA